MNCKNADLHKVLMKLGTIFFSYTVPLSACTSVSSVLKSETSHMDRGFFFFTICFQLVCIT